MNARSAGLAIGLFVGLIICVVIFKYWNKDGKIKTQYDEMQELVRGRAYKYAFWTLVAFEAIMCILSGFLFCISMDNHEFCPLFHNMFLDFRTNGSFIFIVCPI